MARTDHLQTPKGPAPPHGGALPLSRLAPGRSAVIERVDDDHPIGRRLRDLGFVPAGPVSALRRAPLGDPIAYEVRGTQLCLRRRDAERIWVRVVDASEE